MRIFPNRSGSLHQKCPPEVMLVDSGGIITVKSARTLNWLLRTFLIITRCILFWGGYFVIKLRKGRQIIWQKRHFVTKIYIRGAPKLSVAKFRSIFLLFPTQLSFESVAFQQTYFISKGQENNEQCWVFQKVILVCHGRFNWDKKFSTLSVRGRLWNYSSFGSF